MVILVYVLGYFIMLRQEYAAEVESLEPRIARLEGMLSNEEAFSAASENADTLLKEVAYGSGRSPAATAAAMQREIRDVLVGAGLSVAGSQVIEDDEESEGFLRLWLDVTAVGNINSLDDALAQLDDIRPVVFVKSVKIKPERQRARTRAGSDKSPEPADGDPRKLTARFELFSLMLEG
jgi:general secretion pathway protein M